MKEISVRELKENFISLIADEWMLITAGDAEKYNTMTASWGMMGELWGSDVAVCFIRPQRYTAEFVRAQDYYTLSFYGDELKDIHKICGSKSGRDTDKAAETGLTPVFSEKAPYFAQARLVLVCKKLYCDKIKPEAFLEKGLIEKWYPQNDFHEIFVGKIEKVLIKE